MLTIANVLTLIPVVMLGVALKRFRRMVVQNENNKVTIIIHWLLAAFAVPIYCLGQFQYKS
jgi:predicted metallopeptidase